MKEKQDKDISIPQIVYALHVKTKKHARTFQLGPLVNASEVSYMSRQLRYAISKQRGYIRFGCRRYWVHLLDGNGQPTIKEMM